MQGTPVQSLAQEDFKRREATKSVLHNYGVRALEPMSHNHCAQAL